MIVVKHQLDPISSHGRFLHYASGQTLREISESLPLPHEALREHLECRIDGRVYPRQIWRFTKPKDYSHKRPVVVHFHLPLHGGGGR